MIVPTPFRRLRASCLAPRPCFCRPRFPPREPRQTRRFPPITPSAHELSRLTASGSYLAARHAGTQRDAGAAAAYYRASLRGDPKNPELLERAFLSVLAEGDVEEAVRLADQVVKLDKNDRIARLVIGVHALKQKKYAVAKQNLTQSVRGPITDLAATLLAAWASYGADDAKAAVELIDKLQGADWYALFKDLHAGLILDLSGNKKEAGKRFDRAQKLDATALRLVEAYGSWLSRNGKKDEAIKVFKAFDAQLPRHPLIVDEMATLEKDKQLPPLVADAQAGAAEVLYGLGAALGRRGGEDLGLVYLQLALYLAPNQPLALLSLADLYEQVKNPQLAIKIYERMPQNSPLRRNAEIQTRGQSRHHRQDRRSQAAFAEAAQGSPDRYRRDHGARQHPARPQGLRRMRADLQQGRGHHRQSGAAELADLLFPRHLQRARQGLGRRPKRI